MGDGVRIRRTGPGDCGWILQAHGLLYSQQFGLDQAFEALVAEILARFLSGHDPDREAAWVALLDGEPVGSIMCTAHDEKRAKLRLLLVTPAAQGHGVGRRLVEHCLAFATTAGYEAIELWTNDVLTSARRLYQSFGFELVASEPHARFGPPMVGETWIRALP